MMMMLFDDDDVFFMRRSSGVTNYETLNPSPQIKREEGVVPFFSIILIIRY